MSIPEINRMLQGVIDRGTGRNPRGLKMQAGGKTGTTDRYMDAWYFGYGGDYVTGVWIGRDQKMSLGEGAS